MSEQWPQVTRHMPGMVGTGGVTGLGAKLIMRLQLGRGQAIRCEELLQISKQLQGQRTYFLPGGALRMGCNKTLNSIHKGSYKNSTYSCLIAVGALDHVLLPLCGYVNHVLTHATGDHGHAAGAAALIRRWQLIGTNKWHRLCSAAWKTKRKTRCQY